jgi:hypothetical protein
MVYINLSKRYGLSIRKLYSILPLIRVEVDKDMEGAYGFCRVDINKKKQYYSVITLNGIDVTTTTFVHEFGHYIRFLILQVATTKNKNAYSDFILLTDIMRSRADVAKNKVNTCAYNGRFTTEEEENFAKSWEQYFRDGNAPNKKLDKLFKTFKRAIFEDMNNRNQKRNYEFFEDLEVKITPERRHFFDSLLLGKNYKKKNILMFLVELYLYILTSFILFKVLMKTLKIEL